MTMRLWVRSETHSEGKFLVVRRDGTIPAWPHFVMGAKDPAAGAGLRAYAAEARRLGYDPQFCTDVEELADGFDAYRTTYGPGDPDAAPHRTDDPATVYAMRVGGRVAIAAVYPPQDRA